ncbi:MAG: ribonuclease III [Candidatus Omnitrophica bacterium]|nr:ribonuclease III [Candidatus Omnitrophota bacterium]
MKRLEKAIGFKFKRKELLQSALNHPSYHSEGQTIQTVEDFQRLEFLGDSILNSFIAGNLYHLFPKANEGLLSRLRSILVSRKLLARIARSIRLKTYLLLGKRKRNRPELNHEKILADTLEALIAAIYFDRGEKNVRRFLSKYFKPYFDQKKLFQLDPNPKSALQEYTQKKYGSLPVYQIQMTKNQKSFVASVTIRGNKKAKGIGRTKQEAESQAATALLKKLKIKKKISSEKGNSPEG